MKNETFIVIQGLKKTIIRWRMLAFVIIFCMIGILGGNFTKKHKNVEVIARVKITGPIFNNTFSKEKLKALKSSNIKGVILDIDSNGGDVVESEMLYTFFRELSKKKPMVAMIGGSGVSGAYIVAMASDYIVCYNTSIVGSIGVLVQTYEFTELAKKLGISLTNYKSSPLKAAPNPFEKTTPDVDMVISQQINDIYDYFLSIFIERRKIKITEAQEIANGQIYTGRQALEYGLVDKIGSENELLEYFREMGVNVDKINFTDFDIRRNSKKFNFIDVVSNFIKGNGESDNKVMAIYNYQ
ncbi:MAG: signal peptide peptidase SppA [Rickettsiales bacterium]|jgi:protease-4|nr:signal peptide peptidase SppA [Rickettsiales bacterium]